MPLISLLRAFHLAATCVIGGAIAFDLLVLGRGPRALPDLAAQQVQRWLRRLALAAIVVALLSWCGWLAAVAIDMSGQSVAQALAPSVLQTVVTRTSFGHVWALRLVLLVLVAVGLPATAPPRAGVRDAIVALACAAFVGSLAACGHALVNGPVHLAVDAAHLLGAAFWLGMLPPLLVIVRRARDDAPPGSLALAQAALRRFSPPAMFAVVVLVLTGVANAWWLVGTAADLVTTRYGVLLLGKLAFFALMLLLALANRIRWTPRLEWGAAHAGDRMLAARRLHRNVVAELLLGAAVLALVAVLGVTAPPAHQRALHDMSGMHDMPSH